MIWKFFEGPWFGAFVSQNVFQMTSELFSDKFRERTQKLLIIFFYRELRYMLVWAATSLVTYAASRHDNCLWGVRPGIRVCRECHIVNNLDRSHVWPQSGFQSSFWSVQIMNILGGFKVELPICPQITFRITSFETHLEIYSELIWPTLNPPIVTM